jgi:hypothetical protein
MVIHVLAVNFMSKKRWNPDKTIFVQISNLNLKARIEAWAVSRGLEVFNGSGCDLIAVGYRFALVEKEEVGQRAWHNFLDYLRESEVVTPCVVLDTNRKAEEEGISCLQFVPESCVVDLNHFLDELMSRELNIEAQKYD